MDQKKIHEVFRLSAIDFSSLGHIEDNFPTESIRQITHSGNDYKMATTCHKVDDKYFKHCDSFRFWVWRNGTLNAHHIDWTLF